MIANVIFDQSNAFLHPNVNKSVTYHTNRKIIRRKDVLFHVKLTSNYSYVLNLIGSKLRGKNENIKI